MEQGPLLLQGERQGLGHGHSGSRWDLGLGRDARGGRSWGPSTGSREGKMGTQHRKGEGKMGMGLGGDPRPQTFPRSRRLAFQFPALLPCEAAPLSWNGVSPQL